MIIVPPQHDDTKEQVQFDERPDWLPESALRVKIHRTPFMDFFDLRLDNGYTEEVHWEEVRGWFKDRGANMDALEKALDYAWNFQNAEFFILHPKSPLPTKQTTPKITVFGTHVSQVHKDD